MSIRESHENKVYKGIHIKANARSYSDLVCTLDYTPMDYTPIGKVTTTWCFECLYSSSDKEVEDEEHMCSKRLMWW